jgi:hypothetical protein
MRQVMVAAHRITDLAESGRYDIEDTASGLQGHFLIQASYAHAIGKGYVPVIRGNLAINQFEEGRLAGAIASDQRHPLALVQGKADAIKQRMAIAKMNIIE